METLVRDDTKTESTTLNMPKMSFWAFLLRAAVIVILLAAAAFILIMAAPTHKTAVTVTSAVVTPKVEVPAKVGFTFTDQWNKIEVPNGTTIYSRCSPYVNDTRWTVDPTGNMSISTDLSCKKA